MNKQTIAMLNRLMEAGVSTQDAYDLRRIAMTLHRWHELECGDENAYNSFCLVRGDWGKRGKRDAKGGFVVRPFIHDENGKAFMEVHPHSNNFVRYERIPDRETGAKKRLAKIMAAYPALTSYIQTDPRGASLYILRADDVPAGASIDSCYSRGIAVYR